MFYLCVAFDVIVVFVSLVQFALGVCGVCISIAATQNAINFLVRGCNCATQQNSIQLFRVRKIYELEPWLQKGSSLIFASANSVEYVCVRVCGVFM